MSTDNRIRSAFSSAYSFLLDNLPIFVSIGGFLFFIKGLFSILPYNFSMDVAIQIFIGGALMTLGFVAHSRNYLKSTNLDKAYVMSIGLAIMLLTFGVITYTIVEQETKYIGYTTRPLPGHRAETVPTYILVANHIYEQATFYLAGFAIISALVGLYIRSKID
jgi:vacuolar-type H+-ATPase subunit I/STV1